MGRTKSFEPEIALNKAMYVFWAKGYEATSIEDLVEGTGVNRASLYGTFGDKKTIFLQAFGQYVQSGTIARLDAAVQAGSVRPALEALFDRLISRAAEGRCIGCFITNTVTEFGSRDPEILEQARMALAGIENALDRLLRRGQQTGEVPVEADARARARHLLAAMQGLQVISKVNPDLRALRQIADQAVTAALQGGGAVN